MKSSRVDFIKIKNLSIRPFTLCTQFKAKKNIFKSMLYANWWDFQRAVSLAGLQLLHALSNSKACFKLVSRMLGQIGVAIQICQPITMKVLLIENCIIQVSSFEHRFVRSIEAYLVQALADVAPYYIIKFQLINLRLS